MHVNQSLIGQTVFKVAAFRLDASVKTSLPLPDCRVNHTLVKQRKHDVTNYVTLTK